MSDSVATALTSDQMQRVSHACTFPRGFTLVEVVIVIILVGVLAGVVGLIIQGPLQASVDTGRRADLVDLAETALARMTREIRLGVPNSVRIASAPNIVAVEVLTSLDGGRYRAAATNTPVLLGCGAAAAGDPLEFTCADTQFYVLGQLPRLRQIVTGGADCAADPSTADCVVVFNTGTAGANDAYAADNVATITATSDNTAFDWSDQLTITNANIVGLMAPFPLASPAQRFHIVNTPVSFVCNTSTHRVQRFFNYPITAAQSTSPGGTNNLLVDNATACDFTYDPGSATRGGLVTLRRTITEPDSSQSVTLLKQIHVSNQP